MVSRLALALLVLAVACKDDPPPQSDDTTGTTGDGTSTGPGGTSNVTTTPPPPTTTVDPDSTTFGPGCGVDPCPEQCGPDCPSTATCLASVWTCECDCPSTGTTGGDPCDMLDAAVDAFVAGSKIPPVDCGSPGPEDDAFAWETLHGCSTIQAMSGMGLRATWTLADGADPFEYGVAARVGEVYELGWFERSSTGLVLHSCTALVATPDCVVDVGVPCLTCEGQAEVEVICGEGPGGSESGSGSGTGTGTSGSSG